MAATLLLDFSCEGLAISFFVRETRVLLTFFFATWLMGRIEGRSIAEYHHLACKVVKTKIV